MNYMNAMYMIYKYIKQKFDVWTHVRVTSFKFYSKLNACKLNFFKQQ